MTCVVARASAAALLLVAATVRAAPAAAPLAIHAEPSSLPLRGGARATVFIDTGTPSAPSLSASLGSLEDVRALGQGRYAVSYVPPRHAYPQVAIVTATSAGRFASVAIPLIGRGIATARSSPGASIQVTIGEAVFGPVRANGRGEARVPVIVPPGVRFAYHRDAPLDLHIPPTLHVHLVADRTEAPADAPAELRVVAVAVAPDGSPRAGAPLELTASRGEIALAEQAPGTFVGTWRLPAGAPGEAIATARLRDEPGPSSTLTVTQSAGAAARIEVAGAPARANVDDDGPVALRLRVVDAAGNAVPAAPSVETTFGTVSPPVPVERDAWTTELTFPRALGDARRADVTVRAAGLEDRFSIELVAGAPVRLALAPDAALLVADGGTEARIRVSALDRFGNVATMAAPRLEHTGRASVSADADGASWVVRYRPRRARADAAELLSVMAGDLESSAGIALVAPERRVALAPKLGLGWTTGGVRAPYAAVEAGYRPAHLGGHLGFTLELGYLVHERTDAGSAATLALPVHGRARYAPLLGTASWRQPVGGRWHAWAGIGGGVAHVASEVTAAGQRAFVESGFAPAVHASLGCGRRMGHAAPFVELRTLRHGDPGLASLAGSLTVLSISAGYRYDAY